MKLQCEPATANETVKWLLNHEDVKPVISDDNSPEKIDPPQDWAYMVFRNSDDEPVGLICFHHDESASAQIHVQFLKPYRGDTALEASKSAIKAFFDGTDYHKLHAKIPDIYPNVVKFAEDFGFLREGVQRAAYMKGGKLHDVHLLGMTREEFSEV